MMTGRKWHKDCEKDLVKYESFSLILKLIIEALIIHRNTYEHTYIHSNERPVIEIIFTFYDVLKNSPFGASSCKVMNVNYAVRRNSKKNMHHFDNGFR